MIWLTGDTHGHFERIEAFCREKQTTVDDILIILGDAGFNFGGGARDLALKTYASQFPITIFSLHGNRENRPQNIPGYGEGTFAAEKSYMSRSFRICCSPWTARRTGSAEGTVSPSAERTPRARPTGLQREWDGGRTSSRQRKPNGTLSSC